MTKKKNILKAIGIYSFIAMMFVIILYPLLWTFGISLNPGTNLYGAKMIPDNATFKNYAFLLFDDSSQYLTWYKNTLIVASANALFSVIFVTLTAYAFSRY
ncbi:sugar ABC transporter permease, partial [Mammaliicoccus sciuri]